MALFTFDIINEWFPVFEDILIRLIGEENLRHIITQQVPVYETSSDEIEMAIGYDGNLYEDFLVEFREYYDRITVFHGCKPVDVESYRKYGIKPLDIDFFAEQSKLALKDYGVSKQGVMDALSYLKTKNLDCYHERYQNRLCLSVSKKCYYDSSSQYLILGSELFLRVVHQIFEKSESINPVSVLKKIGIPTILHSVIRTDAITDHWMSGVVFHCLEALLQSKMNNDDDIYLIDNRVIEITGGVKPDEIVDIIHPKYDELKDQWK